MTNQSKQIADEIISICMEFGSLPYSGGQNSMLSHLLMCAGLAKEAGADPELVLTAFLHDIGSLCVVAHAGLDHDYKDVPNHAMIGALFLKKRGFSKRVTSLIQYHEKVKSDQLISDANKFGLDSAVAAESEMSEFSGDIPYFADALNLCEWDIAACNPKASYTMPLKYFHHLIHTHLENQRKVN